MDGGRSREPGRLFADGGFAAAEARASVVPVQGDRRGGGELVASGGFCAARGGEARGWLLGKVFAGAAKVHVERGGVVRAVLSRRLAVRSKLPQMNNEQPTAPSPK